MASLKMPGIKKIMTLLLQKLLKIVTFAFMIKKNFSLKKIRKVVFVIFFMSGIPHDLAQKQKIYQNEHFLIIFEKIKNRVN